MLKFKSKLFYLSDTYTIHVAHSSPSQDSIMKTRDSGKSFGAHDESHEKNERHTTTFDAHSSPSKKDFQDSTIKSQDSGQSLGDNDDGHDVDESPAISIVSSLSTLCHDKGHDEGLDESITSNKSREEFYAQVEQLKHMDYTESYEEEPKNFPISLEATLQPSIIRSQNSGQSLGRDVDESSAISIISSRSSLGHDKGLDESTASNKSREELYAQLEQLKQFNAELQFETLDSAHMSSSTQKEHLSVQGTIPDEQSHYDDKLSKELEIDVDAQTSMVEGASFLTSTPMDQASSSREAFQNESDQLNMDYAESQEEGPKNLPTSLEATLQPSSDFGKHRRYLSTVAELEESNISDQSEQLRRDSKQSISSVFLSEDDQNISRRKMRRTRSTVYSTPAIEDSNSNDQDDQFSIPRPKR